MSERDVLVEALVAEALGPRDGPTEVMATGEDPLDEYIVGVLAPAQAHSVELDAQDELVGAADPAADDDAGELPPAPLDGAGLPSLHLAPMDRPASMGISLAVRTETAPVVDICVT